MLQKRLLVDTTLCLTFGLDNLKLCISLLEISLGISIHGTGFLWRNVLLANRRYQIYY